MESDTPASSTSGEKTELRRTLGYWQVAFYGLGSMLGAGIYALIGKAAGVLGNMVWAGFLVALAGAALTALTYASAGSRYPKAGGAAYITQRAFGRPVLSYVVGFAVMMSGLTSMGAGSQAIANILIDAFHWGVDARLLAIALVFLTGCVIYLGIRESMKVNLVCTFVEAAGLLFIIAVGMRFWGSVNYLELPPPPADKPAGAGDSLVVLLILQGAVLTFFSFIGFEDVLNVSEEVKNPRRDVPRGLITAMIAAALIYVAVAVTAVSVKPWDSLTGSNPLTDVAKIAAPWLPGVDNIYRVIAVFAIGNTALLNYLMGTRLLYGMSRQGLMPAPLGKVHPKRKTPHVAVLALFCVVSVLILSGEVKALAEATVLLLLTVFSVMNVALLVLKRRPGEPAGGFEVPSWVPLAGAVICAVLIVTRVTSSGDKNAPLVAGAVIVVALALYALLKPKASAVEEM